MAVPQYKVDQILAVYSGSFTVPAPGLFAGYAEQTFMTGFGDTCLTRCLYTVDGGAKNDDNFPSPIGSDRFAVQATSFSKSNTVGVKAFNRDYTGGASHVISYEIYCYAKSNQGEIEPGTVSQTLAYASKYNYEKIVIDRIADLTVTTGSALSTVVVHNLGYIPDTKTSIEYISGTGAAISEDTGSIYPIGLLPNTENSTGVTIEHNGVKCSVAINETDITYKLLGTTTSMVYTVKLHYRIYADD